jgi:hypothetical protein
VLEYSLQFPIRFHLTRLVSFVPRSAIYSSFIFFRLSQRLRAVIISDSSEPRIRTPLDKGPLNPVKMSGANSPEILAAYDAVRSDKDDTNWLIISYASAVGDKLQLTETGTGGLSELSSKLDPSQAQYAYVRVEYANDTESTRVKFVLIIWIGENTKVMRKARVSIESGEVKRVLGHHSIQVDATEKGDLDEKDIVVRLKKAGGADYNGGRG